MKSFHFQSKSVDDTFQLGMKLGQQLQGNEVVLLEGELGAGKTIFVKGVAQALGIDPEDVFSPAFIILQQLRGKYWLFHSDLYRLEAAAANFDFADYAGEGILAIEWANYLPANSFSGYNLIRVVFSLQEEDRLITISSTLAYLNLQAECLYEKNISDQAL